MSIENKDSTGKRPVKWRTVAVWSGGVIASILLWTFAGQMSLWRTVLVVALSFASFTIGCLAGFVFTSYGEETATVGKIRDWLVGGITGLTIAKAGTIRSLLLTFAYGPDPKEFAISVSMSVTYLGLGFFVMFFQRELIFNVLLAKSRAIRGQVEGTKQAGFVAQRLLAAIPPSIQSGISDIDEFTEDRKAEYAKLKKLLYSDDVSGFLKQAEDVVRSSSAIDWDVVSKAANLHYYRIYFEEDEDRDAQEELAEEWLLRAILMNPRHADLTAKHAGVLAMQENYFEAVAILERLNESPESPAYVQQWLGYYLLYIPNREDDAIRFSEDYHERFRDESDSLFNVACAYAKKYCNELNIQKRNEIPDSENRRMALLKLKEALLKDPDYAKTVRTEWIEPDDFFSCFSKDQEFRILVGLEESPQS